MFLILYTHTHWITVIDEAAHPHVYDVYLFILTFLSGHDSEVGLSELINAFMSLADVNLVISPLKLDIKRVVITRCRLYDLISWF